MSNEANNKQPKVTLTFESRDGKTVERVIEGAAAIEVIFTDAGLLDDEIMALLELG